MERATFDVLDPSAVYELRIANDTVSSAVVMLNGAIANLRSTTGMFGAGYLELLLTKRLWGAENEPPYYHHGRFTTLRQAILAHHGEALESRKAFEALAKSEQDAVVEFLKTLQVLPPGTTALVVDENFKPREWPPQ